MHIINVTVAVVVNAVAGNLPGVGPHIGCQVRMRELDAFVHHGHNDVRVSAGEAFPHIVYIHVGSPGYILGICRTALVVVVPLVQQHRVVESAGDGLGIKGFPGGINLARVFLLGNVAVFGHGHLIQGGHGTDSAVHIHAFLQFHLIPAVQAKLTLQRLFPRERTENRLYGQHAVPITGCQIIGRGNGLELHQEGGGVVYIAQLNHLGLGVCGSRLRDIALRLLAGKHQRTQGPAQQNELVLHCDFFIGKVRRGSPAGLCPRLIKEIRPISEACFCRPSLCWCFGCG